MTRFLAILAALTCAASAQTYRTVTADTNNVIRTNFTLGAAQISGSFAISNVTGLQTALDGKLATNGNAFALTNFPTLLLRTNGSASGLTNFPSIVLQTNSAVTSFPAGLLRTNGDGSGLTNLPNANLSNATGVLPLANGGTGGTNASEARAALELGTAATNDATAFQPADTNLTALASGDGSNLTNVTITDASSLTNFPAELLRTNGDAAGLTNFPSELLRTNGDGSGLSNVSVDLTTVLPPYSGNDGKVLAVATGGTNVEWTAISNTVTDASTLTNFPASILQTNSADGSFPAFLLRTNGSAAGLTSFPASLLTTNGDASGLTNFPTLNQNTTGTASNVTGVVAIANGGSGQTTAEAAIEAFLPAYSGNADRILALNSNATGLIWTTNAGGGGLTSPVAIVDGGTGATNAGQALTNLTILKTNGAVQIGNGAAATNTRAIAIGESAVTLDNDAIQIGRGTNVLGSSIQFLSHGNVNSTEWGYLANASTIGGSILTNTTAAGALTNLTVYQSNNTVLIGQGANSKGISNSVIIGALAQADWTNDHAITVIGHDAESRGTNSVAIGQGALINGANSIQLGKGLNYDGDNVFSVFSWGSVNSNRWGALANAGTVGTNLLRSTNIAGAQAAIFTNTTTNAPTNTNAPTPDAWLDIRVGTNNYKLPLWQ